MSSDVELDDAEVEVIEAHAQATPSRPRKRKSANEVAADSPAAASTTSSGRRRHATIDYAQMDAGAEEGSDEDGSHALSEADDPPTKKRKSTSATKKSSTGARKRKAVAAAAPASTNDELDATGDEEDDGEDRRSNGSRRKMPSKTAARKKPSVADEEAARNAAEAYFGATNDAIDDAEEMTSEEVARFRRNPNADDNDKDDAMPLPQHDPTQVASAGILTRLRLKNFMNHTNFEIKFNPNVNFIHGANGSGKSSILHAIQLVFGAKAADTSRGKGLGALIQRGKETAEVTVQIKNHAGPHAYKHELYGDEIILTRKLTRTKTKDGASSKYTMSGVNAAGEKHTSTSPAEVREMYESFNIQVKNPCVVMTQEVSKKFLQSKKAEDKYHFFVSATQLETLRETLSDAHTRVCDMGTTVEAQQEKIPDLDKQIAHYQKLEKLAEEAEELERQIAKLANQMLWRRVQDKEIEYDEWEAKRTDILGKIETTEAKIQALEASHQTRAEFQAEVDAHTTKANEHSTQVQTYQAQAAEKNKEIVALHHETRKHQARKEQLKHLLQKLAADKRKNEKEIATIAERNSRDTSQIDAQLDEKRRVLEEKKTNLEAEYATINDEINTLNEKDRDLRREMSERSSEANQDQQAYNRARADLEKFQQEHGAVTSAVARSYNPPFEAHTRLIHAEIAKRQWAHRPIGPLGEYIEIRPEQEKWLKAITECLTNKHMSSYVVHNFQDLTQLREIIDHVWRTQQSHMYKPNIMMLPKRPRYPVRPPQVPFPLVHDCITIEDDWAYNATIFLAKPERVGLHDELKAAVADLERVRHTSQDNNNYATGSHLLDGTRILLKGRSTNAQLPSERQMFKVSQAERLKELQDAVQEAKDKFDESKRSAQEKGHEQRTLNAQIDPLKKRKAELSHKLQRLDAEFMQLEQEAERARREMEKIDDTPFVDAVARLTNEMAEYQDALDELERTHDPKVTEAKVAAIRDDIAGLDEKIRLEEGMIQEENDWVTAAIKRWAKHDGKMKKYNELLRTEQTKLADCEAKFSAVSVQLSVLTEQAQQQCPEREESDLTLERLSAQHDAKLATLTEKRRRQPIDIVSVRSSLKAAQVEKARTEERISGIRRSYALLKSMGQARARKLLAMRKTMANSTSYAFGAILQPQGAHGKLVFDHVNQTLEIVVNPNVRDAERQDSASTIVLSGGERSVTTIAFVMAIGEQVESPFRAIDEFDVFMDSMNRRTSMELLLNIAKHRKDRQFFFLSPQDITGLNPNAYFAVHKLKEPLRGQMTMDQFQVDEHKEEE